MIVPARARKVAGDLGASRSRTVLVSLSIALGVTAVGTVVGARTLMLRSLDASRVQGAFPSATLLTEPFAPGLFREVRRVRGVEDAEARRVVGAQVHAGGAWRDLTLLAAPRLDRLRIGRIARERGAWPPPPGTMLVERSSRAALLDPARLRLPSGIERVVRIAGTVHDLNVPSTRTSGILYGYVTPQTLARLGGGVRPNELLLRTGGDRRAAETVAARVRRLLAAHGVGVRTTIVPEPGVFWAEDAVDAMILLLTVLAVVCLAMSAFLVVNIVSALVAQQARQIGVMKAVGASARETACLYLATATVYGLAALVVAVPVGAVAALALVTYSVGVINLDVPGFSVPPQVLVLELAAGLGLPLLAALAPVVGASRVTVREAIASHGLGGAGGTPAALAARARALPVALRLAVTNTFRRRRRLLLTTAGLALGGAVFVGVLSVRASLDRTLREAAPYRGYDVDLSLDRPYAAGALERAARSVAGVARAQAWPVAGAYRLRPDGSESETFSVVGVPSAGDLLRPVLVRGRGLRPGDGRAVVVNTDVLESEPGLRPGDRIRLAVAGRSASTWHVVGVAKRIVAGPVVYASSAPLARAAGAPGLARRLVVVTEGHGEAAEARVAAAVTRALALRGVRVESARTSASLRALDRRNLGIIVSFLLAMAVLLAAVGGFGLAGMLSINVLERSREIGVLRAVGAGDGDVAQLVVVEGLIVALVGWLLAAPLGLLVARGLSSAVGTLFLGAPLSFAYSIGGLALWLALALVLAAAASVLPARRAARLTVRDVLAYE